VISANAARGDSGTASGAHSAPLVEVSAASIARNARIALAAGRTGSPPVADLRADAWGHGAEIVAAELVAAGVTAFRVDEGMAASLSRTGAPRVTSVGEPDLDMLTVFGLPGGQPGSVPAMRFIGTVLSTKRLLTGEGVSYGYTYRASSDTHVALVSGGYAQGVVRALGNRISVTAGSERLSVVGRVAMDVCVVVIGDAAVRRGDEVVFFGDPARGEPSIGEWEKASGMSGAELITAVGLRGARERAA
jgi:alanine racemase